MTIEEFIAENREELARAIWRVSPNNKMDDDEIEMWIENDEGLYSWALDCGVEV